MCAKSGFDPFQKYYLLSEWNVNWVLVTQYGLPCPTVGGVGGSIPKVSKLFEYYCPSFFYDERNYLNVGNTNSLPTTTHILYSEVE